MREHLHNEVDNSRARQVGEAQDGPLHALDLPLQPSILPL